MQLDIHLSNTEVLQNICGVKNKNISLIETLYNTEISIVGDKVYANISEDEKFHLEELFTYLKNIATKQSVLERDILYINNLVKNGQTKELNSIFKKDVTIGKTFAGKNIYPKTLTQRQYYYNLENKDIIFAIGPAGTGKTYLAVIYAVSLLKQNKIRKIILTRPVVNVDESLGFLPGDLKEKIDPYLRPLYDALYDSLGVKECESLIEHDVIEIAPLAYMRGRTLESACIILDEAQNTTTRQMKMFLTRLGNGSKMIITGDITQNDLPKNVKSGLEDARHILANIDEIGFVEFDSFDVVRHYLVQKIIERYEEKNK